MELTEFFEKFLPDYEEKLADSRKAVQSVKKQQFEQYYFPEALQNFADRICEKQRGICANSFVCRDFTERMSVEKANQPNIDEL